MNERWWTRVFDRKDWIGEAAKDAFEAFARELDQVPSAAHAEEPKVEPAGIPLADKRRKPSFA